MNRVMIIFTVLIVCFTACNLQSSSSNNRYDGVFGKTTWQEWKEEAGGETYSYEPDKEILKSINVRLSGKEFEFVLFAGSWCSDSWREVPKMFKVMHELDINDEDIRFYGVDRDKKDGLGEAEKFGITHVPTLILLVEGKEKGRIIENSDQTIEKDILNFLKEN